MAEQPISNDTLSFAQATVLHGTARVLRGEALLTNRGSVQADLSQVELRIAGNNYIASAYHSLPPGGTTAVPLKVPLPRSLPAGAYTGEILAGTARGQVTVVVATEVNLEFKPDTIYVTEKTGRTRAALVAMNAGTIPLNLPERVGIGLAQARNISDAVHESLRAVGREGFQRVADAVVMRMTDMEIRPAVLRFTREQLQLAPGEQRVVECEIQLPKDLPLNKHIAGDTKIYNATLRLEIEIYGSDGMHPEEQPQDEQAN